MAFSASNNHKENIQEDQLMENYSYNSSALLIVGMLIGIVYMLLGM